MPNSSQKTEKPTPRRLEKARQDGEFPAAREFVSALQFITFISLAAAYFPGWIAQVQGAMTTGIRHAFSPSLTAGDLMSLLTALSLAMLQPLAALGGILILVTLLLQAGATNLGFSLS